MSTIPKSILAFVALILGAIIGCGDAKTTPQAEAEKESKFIAARLLGNWEGKMQIDDAEFQEYVTSNQIPQEFVVSMRQSMEDARIYFAFQKDGTGISGAVLENAFMSKDITWEITSETGNQARIETKNNTDGEIEGITDITFEAHDKFVGQPILNKDNPNAMPQFKVQFHKIEHLPRESESKTDSTKPLEKQG